MAAAEAAAAAPAAAAASLHQALRDDTKLRLEFELGPFIHENFKYLTPSLNA